MLIIEKYLDVLGGHESTQVDTIQSLVGERSVGAVTGRACEVFPEKSFGVFPVLSTRKEIGEAPERAINNDVNSMNRVLSWERVQHVPILYPTPQAHDLRVALRPVSSSSFARKLYMRVLLEREVLQLTDGERAGLKSAIASDQIVLLTETASLAVHFQACYGLKFHETALCLPCSLLPGQTTSLSSLAPSKEGHYRVGCLGGWRAEKGVDMLPQLMRHLRYALDVVNNAPTVEMIIQKPPPKKSFKGFKKSIIRDYPFWRSVGFSVPGKRLSLTFLTTKLSKEDFVKTLMSVDVLVVPYRLEDYRHRGSGIILDGVAAQKPIVYTRGMGMNEFLIHGNTEAAMEDPKDYADKVVKILSDMETYRTATHQAARELKRKVELTASFLRSI